MSGIWKGENGNFFMVRCPKCEKENYALNVASGICTWCGYEATEKDLNKETK